MPLKFLRKFPCMKLKEKREEVNNQIYALEAKAYMCQQKHNAPAQHLNGSPCPNIKHKLHFRKILKVLSEGRGRRNLHVLEREKFIDLHQLYFSLPISIAMLQT